MREFTSNVGIPQHIYDGIFSAAQPYVADHALAFPLAQATVTEDDLKRAVGKPQGVVEVSFDKALIDRLMKHRGAHLLVAIEPNTHPLSVAGFSVFFTDDSDLPSEAEAGHLSEFYKRYHPLCWLYYVVVGMQYSRSNVLRLLVERSIGIMKRHGCRHLVADYMIFPEVCVAGVRLLLLSYFRHSGERYGPGLVPQDLRGENCDRQDVFELMIRDLDEPKIWKVHPSEQKKLKELTGRRIATRRG